MGAVGNGKGNGEFLVVPILMFLTDDELHFIHASLMAGKRLVEGRYHRTKHTYDNFEEIKGQYEAAKNSEIKFMTGRERYNVMVESANSDT